MASKPGKPTKKPAAKGKTKVKAAPSGPPGLKDIKLSPTKRAQLARIHALGILNKQPKKPAKPASKGVSLTGEASSRPTTKDF